MIVNMNRLHVLHHNELDKIGEKKPDDANHRINATENLFAEWLESERWSNWNPSNKISVISWYLERGQHSYAYSVIHFAYNLTLFLSFPVFLLLFFFFLNRFRQRTTDVDALDLYNKKVKVVNPKTGEITYKFYSPDIGMKKVKQGGKSMDVNWFRWQFYANVKFSNKIALASGSIEHINQMNFQSDIFFGRKIPMANGKI